jgi:hypothetical protein
MLRVRFERLFAIQCDVERAGACARAFRCVCVLCRGDDQFLLPESA